MRTRRHLPTRLGFLAVMAVSAAMPGPARAQYGMGMGWGWGMFGPQESSSTRLLNDHALSRVGGVQARQQRSHSAYSGNPNAYFNRIRDNGFVSHYDVRRRRAPSYQPERTASLANRGQGTDRPAPRAPAVPLKDFFDASLRLVWPQESPVEGEFKEKREISDQASLAVLKQAKAYGSAPITSAAEARQKLVSYGKPALQHLRAAATPPIADSFHRFLLSLYDSLEASALASGAAPVPQP